jgi:uncharacterized repeat protein (TIGR04076 family)
MTSMTRSRPGSTEAPQDDQLLQAAGPKGRQPCTDGARPVIFKIESIEEES